MEQNIMGFFFVCVLYMFSTVCLPYSHTMVFKLNFQRGKTFSKI